MTDWPSNLSIGPISEWPGALTPASQRKIAPFRVKSGGYSRTRTPLSATTELLDRELRALRARHAEMLIAMRPEDFRNDGFPRAQAVASHPGVILSFDSSVGHLSYPTDTFTTWQDNLRAVALALEALRKVDRYGVTKRGEQYRGFLALEATPAQKSFPTAQDAAGHIRALSGERPELGDREGLSRAVRLAKRNTHPDRPGGSTDAFHNVTLAEEKLRAEGWI
jgi:hypothetical protein